MKIYTKTGDKGTTSLLAGTRVPKHHIRIDTYGTVDELNAHVGMIRNQDIEQKYKNLLSEIQTNLFNMGSAFALHPDKAQLKNGKNRLNIDTIEKEDVEQLETAIDAMNAELPPLRHFILPGGNDTVSHCHISRTVCRRAERMATALYEQEAFDEFLLKYLNRLSDYLFVLARKLGHEMGVQESQWIPKKKK